MQKNLLGLTLAIAVVISCTAPNTQAQDPRTNSWLTSYSGQYARISTTDTNRLAGNSVTTWSKGSLSQSLPAYVGVQEIYSSASWVYLRNSGPGNHIMGP